jgi:alpha-L-fucosidase
VRSATVLAVVLFISCRSAAPPAPPASIAPAVPLVQRPEMGWWRQSQETREERLGWWREARFGMFMHWGVYSHLAGVWNDTPVRGYAEHIQRMRKISMKEYRERAVAEFNPTHFDADAWVGALKDAGMGYLIITAKHHDGFAMYDSEVSDYNVVKATPWHHDPMRDLKAACDRHGVKFGFYYSHAFDWGDPDAPGNDWEYDNPGGDRHLHGGERWWEAEPARLEQVRRYVDRKAIPQLRELIRKYDPAIIWFDTPHKLPAEETLRILRAVREAKPSLVVNSRVCQPVPGPRLPTGFGDYLSTTDKPAEFPPHSGDWEAIPTTNESYGYHRLDDSHKPPAHFIRLLVKAAARGGNVLLNIGPRGDGQIDPKDLSILGAIGRWMAVNGESIRGTTTTPLPVQAWGESTRKGNTLYLHVFEWPAGGKLEVGGLRAKVTGAHLLGAGQTVLRTSRSNETTLRVELPAGRPDPIDSVVALQIEGPLDVDPRRLLSPDVEADTLRAFDGQLEGHGLAFGAGKTRDASVHGWSDPRAAVRWPVVLNAPASFDVYASYDAEASSAGGRYQVALGTKVLAGSVQKSAGEPALVGHVSLEPGTFDIVVQPTRIAGSELMRLRGLVLRPVRAVNPVSAAPPARPRPAAAPGS